MEMSTKTFLGIIILKLIQGMTQLQQSGKEPLQPKVTSQSITVLIRSIATILAGLLPPIMLFV